MNVECTESLHVYACKRFLNVKKMSCNNAILGDLGRYPMYINAAKRCIKYWLKVLNSGENRYIKLCYNMLLYYDRLGYRNWVTEVRNNLYRNGFGYIWEAQFVENQQLFINAYVQRLKDQYIQNWMNQCSLNTKLRCYKDFKQSFELEPYISVIVVSKFRTCMALFRSSSHVLMIERGRYYNIPREYRFCIYCECIVETEMHFVLECPLYKDIRECYVPRIYTDNPTYLKFCNLFASKNETVIRNLAMYLYYATKLRNEHISD